MSDKCRIFCVDDDEHDRLILEKALTDFDCTFFDEGLPCVDQAIIDPPELILIDVKIPGMDGFEVCQRMREHTELKHTFIIFVSTQSELEDRLKGYLAGGDDYLAKPFSESELIAKVKAVLQRQRMLELARKTAKESQSVTAEIVSAMGEMSAVVYFLQSTFSCSTYELLAQKIIGAHESLGLEIAIEFDIEGEKQHFNTEGIDNPLEISAFDFVRSKGRLIDVGVRTAVNYPNVTIIVRNMPTNDPELHGRIRDHIALIAQGANSKLNALRSDGIIKKQRENLIQIMDDTKEILGALDTEYKEQQTISENILSTIAHSIEDSFMNLGLTTEQEEFQRAIIEMGEKQMNALFSVGLAMDEKFDAIIKQVEYALSSNVIVEQEEEKQVEDVVSFF